MIADVPAMLEWVQWASLAAAGLVLTGLYAGAETGIYVLNKLRLDLRAEGSSRAARSLRGMLQRSDSLLAGLLIGTNLAAYLTTFAVGAMFVLAGYERYAELCTLAVATPLLFVFAESVPKNLFQRSAETLVYRLVWFLRASMVAFTACGLLPLVRGFAGLLSRLRGGAHPLAHEGLATILAEGQAAGLLTHAQSIMADRVMQLGGVRVAEVCHPMKTALWAPQGITREQLFELVKDHNYSRVPILGAEGRVVGILNIYDVLMAPEPVQPADRMTPPLLIGDRMTVTDALYRMQRAHAAMAIVTDTDGKHIGLVTIKDLVEEIVGELEAW
ncbi:MAG TPA: CNNM domain-containing protein [Phycisphaerae bacterium]|nr:CNNM domain-containing protein [Phycisphaerae bacterium]